MSEQEKASNADENSADEIQEEKAVQPPYIPKNPMLRPADVKISEIMQKLLGEDKKQEQLHRVLGSTCDIDNEFNLANHIQQVFEVLVDSYPDCALDKLEEVSYLIRKKEDLSRFLTVCLDRDYKKAAQDLANYIEKTKPLFSKPATEEEGDDPPETAPVCMIGDLLADAKLFAWAGISIGQQESYLLQKSLQKLASSQSASFLRFFGKIRCTGSDYYIAETTVEGGEEDGAGEGEGDDAKDDEKDPNMEERGTGVNKYTYFVTTNPFTAWKRLPDLTTRHIEAARRVKVLFSGDLERDIICNPFFFGKEKHLLRAQIARISHSTALVPAGSHKLQEENDREIEEFVPDEESKVEPLPSTVRAAKLNAWVHYNPSILDCGRTVHVDPPEEAPEDFQGEEYDVEVAKKEIEAADPFQPRLKPVTDDAKIGMGGKREQSSWTVRLAGDPAEYKNEQGDKMLCHGVVVIRSLVWPGSFTFYQNGKQTSIYVGQGLKFSDKMRPFPLCPPVLTEDPTEYEEFVLPVVKELTAEDIKAKVEQFFDDAWNKQDSEDTGAIDADGAKKVAAEIKAKITEAEEAEVNEEAFDAALEQVQKNDDGNYTKDSIKEFMAANYTKL